MTIQELAAYAMPKGGQMSSAGRADALVLLQQLGYVENAVRQWDLGTVKPEATVKTIKGFIAALERLNVNHAHRAFDAKQRAEIEQAAHDAARMAGELKEKHPQIWGQRNDDA